MTSHVRSALWTLLQISYLEHFNRSDSELVLGLSSTVNTEVRFDSLPSGAWVHYIIIIATLVNRPDEKLVNLLCALDKAQTLSFHAC